MFWTSLYATAAILTLFLFIPVATWGIRKVRQPRASSATAGATAAGGTPPPAPPTPGTIKKGLLGRVFNLGFFALYGLVLGVMILMLVWAGDYLAYIGDFYQTVAVTMVVIGVALIIATKGRFWPLVAMIAVFGYLAVTSPEQSARAIAVAKKDGAVAAISAATAPTPAQQEAIRKERAAESKARAEELRLQAELAGTTKAAYEKEMAKNAPLTEAAFTTKTVGTFYPLQIKSGERIGPINAYKKTCFHWDKSGMGMFFVYSRTDFVSEPVTAKFADSGYSINEWGHAGAPVQLFLEARSGDIQIELERYDC